MIHGYIAKCPKCKSLNERYYKMAKLPRTTVCDKCGERWTLAESYVMPIPYGMPKHWVISWWTKQKGKSERPADYIKTGSDPEEYCELTSTLENDEDVYRILIERRAKP